MVLASNERVNAHAKPTATESTDRTDPNRANPWQGEREHGRTIERRKVGEVGEPQAVPRHKQTLNKPRRRKRDTKRTVYPLSGKPSKQYGEGRRKPRTVRIRRPASTREKAGEEMEKTHMKYRTTAKELRNNSGYIVSAGYCDLQDLFRDISPNAYTCGVYGWNFDVYDLDEGGVPLTVCTGYRGMVGKRAEGIEEYEAKARKVWSGDGDYVTKREAVRKLRAEFIDLNTK